VEAALDEILEHVGCVDASAPSISKWSSHQQLEHAALAALGIAGLIQRLNAGEGELTGRVSLAGRAMLVAGRIPRGRGQAPESFLPSETPDPERPARIRQLVEKARAALREAGPPVGRHRWPHHHLGPMTAKQWLRFGTMHTRHHIHLAKDITNAAR
jgi:hypothetical protein